MSHIHPTAIIDPGARIAPTVRVGPFCVIGPDVTIGEGTVLHNNVTIQALTTLGRDNLVYPYSVIGADPQDKKFRGERAYCVIGDRNQIREHVTIHRGTGNGGGVTRVGNDNLIMVAAHVAHDCVIEDQVVIANQVMLAGHVRVEEGANLGGGAGVHHFATVGTCAFVGGLARVRKDVPPFCIVDGDPAEARAVNVIGMSRRGYTAEHIEALKEAFKRLFRSNGAPMSEKLDALLAEFAAVPAVLRLCRALAAAAEGVHGRALEVHRPDNKRVQQPVAVEAPMAS